jgi:hypothetical protein
MMRSSKIEARTEVTVVVIELGAPWPSNIDELRRDAPESIVLAQTPDESLEELAERVRSRLARLERAERVVRNAVLARGPATGMQALAARRRIAAVLRRPRPHGDVLREPVAYAL